MNGRYNEIKITNLLVDKFFLTLIASSAAITFSTTMLKSTPTTQAEIVSLEDLRIQNDDDIIDKMIMGISRKQTAIPEIKDYSGMRLSNELEDEIKRIAEIYNVPYQIVLAIGERESAGLWNNDGVISSTNDYGQFQINECNLKYIEENLGYSKEEILNDSIKNAEACIFLLRDIINRKEASNMEQVFGMYNGWIGWENKSMAVEYSESCCNIINSYFPDFEYDKKQKSN